MRASNALGNLQSVHAATINVSYRAGWQAEVTDPAFPVALALGYSAYKFFSKRKNRNPDGPFFGGSPIWGALAMTGVALALGALVSQSLPQPCLCPTHARHRMRFPVLRMIVCCAGQ